ncbi:predicted protein [Sclerotinia sclerotiorum 1980 UF-70]|uniref:Uncharacterized protein n=1 Tax=Sclerotinia sclerotiorum (strain ATCC 18683 / 1980 / Ss-1) TaxID=665079 RepID=A7EEV1_SCLS1|nr:predicted protein [Sclerotinia sclerotiorum 1980 UF-70]EDO01367.1 predicted protein [Sclerotinia sclerotiorum 1980 UF-70]
MRSVLERMQLFAEDLVTREVQNRGHWVHFEAKDEVNGFLDDDYEGKLSYGTCKAL